MQIFQNSLNYEENFQAKGSLFPQFGFSNCATFRMQEIIVLHNTIMYFLVLILTVVIYLLYTVITNFRYDSYHIWEQTLEKRIKRELDFEEEKPSGLNTPVEDHELEESGTTLETLWTIIPACVLGLIAVPSFILLYRLDEIVVPAITIKAVGRQWYWHYEEYDFYFGNILYEKDAYLSDDGKTPTSLRVLNENFWNREVEPYLLGTTNEIILPVFSNIRFIVTATDVLHSWAVPALGVKIDACPGRLNEVNFMAWKPGIFYGQCSEICGINHGFMPIAIRITPFMDYYWAEKLSGLFGSFSKNQEFSNFRLLAYLN